MAPSGTVTSASLELVNATCKHTQDVAEDVLLIYDVCPPLCWSAAEWCPCAGLHVVCCKATDVYKSPHVTWRHHGQQGWGGKLQCHVDADRVWPLGLE